MSELLLRNYLDLYSRSDVLDTLTADSPSGAYLISGDDADGLNIFARLVAMRLSGLDLERALDDFADIVTYPLPPEKKQSKGKKAAPTKSEIMVDDVREIVNSLYLTPFELPRRFYILENAESMSEICQNKLLKSLEEPPARVCFILCATRKLLDTVESRCHLLRLAPFDTATVELELAKRHSDAKAVGLAAKACRGNLGLAERILADKDFGATYSAALRILKLATGSKMFAHTAAVYDKFSREKADATLGLMEFILCDVARYLSGLDTVFDRDDVASVSVGYTPYSAAACAEYVRLYRRRNGANCMTTAVMDGVVLKIMEEKALCQR